jgi:hypothetical protein
VSTFATIGILIAVAVQGAATWRMMTGHPFQWRLLTTATYLILFMINLAGVIVYALDSHYGGVALSVLGMIWCGLVIWWLWRNRGNRGKALGFLGAKSRALRDKVVRKMREVTVPSPVPA